MKDQDQIRQTNRGEYTHKRKKKFDYLRNTGRLDDYYKSKQHSAITQMPSVRVAEEETRLAWYQRFWNWIKKL